MGLNANHTLSPNKSALPSITVSLSHGYSTPTPEITSSSPPIPYIKPHSKVCSDNRIYKGLGGLRDALTQPETVCYLDLSRSNISALPNEVLRLSNLDSLYLNYNF